MENLEEIKKQLRTKLSENDIAYVLSTLKELLPDESPKTDFLVALKASYNKINSDILLGQVSKKEENLQLAILTKRLIDFLKGLEPSDFDKSARRSHLARDQKIKTGHVLYRIPKEMQLGEESRCLVRIAFDTEMIVEGLNIDADTALRQGVRISDYMKVEIVDPSANGVFDIRTTSESVQLIDTDDFTEWKFYVTPTEAGKHMLELKVKIMLKVDGETRVREKTLEESVVIITELPAQQEDKLPWEKVDEQMVIPCAPEVIMPRPVRLIPSSLRNMAASLLLILGLGTTAYAVNLAGFQESVDWFATTIKDTSESYDQFADKHPDSPRREQATYKKADALLREGMEKAAEAALLTYKNAYPAGQHVADALWQLAQLTQLPEDYLAYLNLPGEKEQESRAVKALERLEPKVWKEVKSQTSPVGIDRYLRLYPDGKYRREAIEKLAEAATWAASQSYQLRARLQPDTLEMAVRLLILTRKAAPHLYDAVKEQLQSAPIYEGKEVFIRQKGTVLDASTDQPVPNATVSMTGQQLELTAVKTPDGKGGFAVDIFPVGLKVKIQVSASGYRDTTYLQKIGDDPFELKLRDAKQDTTQVGGEVTSTGSGEEKRTTREAEPAEEDTTKADEEATSTSSVEEDRETREPDPIKEVVAKVGDGVASTGNGEEDRETKNSDSAEQGTEEDTSDFAPPTSDFPKMVQVQRGTFTMGCESEERDGGCDDDESPAHKVTVGAFYMSVYEVTFEKYDAFCEATGRDKPADEGWGRGNRPVINVSWYDAVAYCNWLSEQQGYEPVYELEGREVASVDWNANGYRLPTEAEWEYAARGGEAGAKDEFLYSGSDDIDAVAWYYDNSGSTHEVGQKQPNQLGLYDMSGNVYEWVQDCWHEDYKGAPKDGSAWLEGNDGDCSRRVLRGGSWVYNSRYSRVAGRNYNYPAVRLNPYGFRLARD